MESFIPYFMAFGIGTIIGIIFGIWIYTHA